MVRVSEGENTLLNVRNELNTILSLASHKKKTTKWKACIRTCKMFLSRCNATIEIHQNGGSSDDVAVSGDSIIYGKMYSDIVEYWILRNERYGQ